MRKSYFKEM